MIAWLVVLTSIFLDDAGALHVKMVDAPVTDSKGIVLRVGDRWLEPTAVTRQPVAIAVVVQGTQDFMGANTLEGAYAMMAPGFDRVVHDFKAPPGSTLTILTFGYEVMVRLPATPFDKVPDSPLGKQHEYQKRIGHELVRAVERGMIELDASSAPIKELIVICDGVDAEPATGPQRLRAVVERGIARGIKTHAIVRGTTFDIKDGDDWATLEPTVAVTNYPEQIETRLRVIFDAIMRRMELTFEPGAFVADGRIYDLRIEYGADNFPFRFEMPGRRAPTAVTEPAHDRRWKLVTAGGAVLALLGIAIAFVWRRAVR